MPIRFEKEQLTPELIQEDPDVDWALKALQSLGITSAANAPGRWRISVIDRGEWQSQKGVSTIHLFPWNEGTEANRRDRAWFVVAFDSDDSRYVVCERSGGGVQAFNLISEHTPKSSYPKRWHELNISGYNQKIGANIHFGVGNEVVMAAGHDDHEHLGAYGHFGAYATRDGTVGIDEALARIGRDLGKSPQEMPGRTTFNPGLIANAILDPALPYDVPQMICQGRL